MTSIATFTENDIMVYKLLVNAGNHAISPSLLPDPANVTAKFVTPVQPPSHFFMDWKHN